MRFMKTKNMKIEPRNWQQCSRSRRRMRACSRVHLSRVLGGGVSSSARGGGGASISARGGGGVRRSARGDADLAEVDAHPSLAGARSLVVTEILKCPVRLRFDVFQTTAAGRGIGRMARSLFLLLRGEDDLV